MEFQSVIDKKSIKLQGTLDKKHQELYSSAKKEDKMFEVGGKSKKTKQVDLSKEKYLVKDGTSETKTKPILQNGPIL